MVNSDVLGVIRKLKQEYDSEIILNVKGYSFTQRTLIDLIENYWDSKFISGDKDRGGLYKFFNNIIKFPTRISSKMIDFDTKDFRFYADEGQSHAPVYLFNKELKAYMRDQDFGYILNRIVKNTPKYGNHIIKDVNGETSSVRFRNIICDPYVEFITDSYLVIEEHYMTPADLIKMRGKWDSDEIDAVLKQFETQNRSTILVSECYVYGSKGFFQDNKSDKFVRGMVIVADLDNVQSTKEDKLKIIKDNSRILFKGVKEKLPYYEFFWDEFQGTYIRTGVPLELLEEQFSQNDAAHQERKGLYWTGKRIYQTKDMLVGKNMMLDVEDGDVLRVNSEITPVQNQERNLPAYNNQYQQIDKNRREKTMTFESVSGETLPSGTPFRLGFVQSKAAGGYFDFQREDIGLLLKRFILEVIVPTFKSKSKKAHTFNLYGVDNELQAMEDLLIEQMMHASIQEKYKTTGLVPTVEEVAFERENVKAKLRSKPNRRIKIEEGLYDDLKYKMDLLVTDESMALDSKSTTLTTALQTVSTNPGILQDPVTRKIFFRLLEFGGISPEELQEAASQKGVSMPMMQQPTLSPPPGPAKPSELNMGGPANKTL